jgi:acyl-CoA synthetase (AMP-forming)/AMP-acid ligase II
VPGKMAQFIVINSPFSFYWNWMMKMTDTTASRHKISMLKLMDKNEAVHVYGTKLAYIIHSSGSTGQGKSRYILHGNITLIITDLRCLKLIFIYFGGKNNIHSIFENVLLRRMKISFS